jgi:hypothetical protein
MIQHWKPNTLKWRNVGWQLRIARSYESYAVRVRIEDKDVLFRTIRSTKRTIAAAFFNNGQQRFVRPIWQSGAKCFSMLAAILLRRLAVSAIGAT